jgi:serine acetyltransferase
VVIEDVPANSIAVGVPARILPRRRAGQPKHALRTG